MHVTIKRASIAMALAFGIAGSAGVGVGSALAQSDDGLAQFTWSMPNRFGHLGLNGLVRYPQSSEEVDQGPFQVDVVLDERACAIGLERTWTVANTEVVPDRANADCSFSLSFQREGEYDLTLRVSGDGHDDTSTQRVVVQDLLIVALGDSVASGEGNREVTGRLTRRWEDRRCHRSALAGTARAAATAEAADTHSSVTFVHLACSGATVPRGLTGWYEGAQKHATERPQVLRSQLDELDDIAEKRQIDAVLLSVGANDIGFARIVRFCWFHRKCAGAGIKAKALGLRDGEKRPLKDAVAEALDGLEDRYKQVAARLRSDLEDPKSVFVVEYFDVTRSSSGAFCKRILGRIKGDEVKWAYEGVLHPLNQEVKAAADARHWTYVPGVAAAFETHGWCAGDTWVVHPGDSFRKQLGFAGTLHPNAEGHAATAEQIAQVLDPVLFENGQARAPRSPEVQDDLAAEAGVIPASLAAASGGGDGDPGTEILAGVGGLALGAAAVGGGAVLRTRRRREEDDPDSEADPKRRLARRADADKRWLRVAQVARVLGAVAVIGLAIGLLFENHPDSTRAGVVAGLLVIGVVLLIVQPIDIRRMLERIEHVKTPFLEASLGKAVEAASQAQPEQMDVDEADPGPSVTMVDLRLKLEAKLAYIAKLLLKEYATIGSLRNDGYLTDTEAAVASDVFALADADLRSWDPAEKGAFLKHADETVGGIRASVFRGMVRKALEDADWEVDEKTFDASVGVRPDFCVTRKDNSSAAPYRVVPVFATRTPSKIFDRGRGRLERKDRPELARRILVVPDRAGPITDEHPRSFKLSGLLAALESDPA